MSPLPFPLLTLLFGVGCDWCTAYVSLRRSHDLIVMPEHSLAFGCLRLLLAILCGQVWVGRWICDSASCGRVVEYDGHADALFSMRRRNKDRRWLLFTRGLLDKVVSFIIAGRTTYTAATRHLSADVQSFALRRQDVVKLGTAFIRTLHIPAETARCPLCGPNPAFIVIDAQSLGCTDLDDTHPLRPSEDCPVLDIPASKLCVIEHAPLRDAVAKVLRTSAALTATQASLLRSWAATLHEPGRPSPSAAAARVFFRFFPLGSDQVPPSPATGGTLVGGESAAAAELGNQSDAAAGRDGQPPQSVRGAAVDSSAEGALRSDGAGGVVLGGKGALAKKPTETWRDRTGICRPAFEKYPREDDGVWICVRPFLQSLLTETVAGMFTGFNESAIRLVANTMRLKSQGAWRSMTEALDGIGFVSSFVGLFADEIDEDRVLRVAIGELLRWAVEMEKHVDGAFAAAAANKTTLDRGWLNEQYSARWRGTPTPAEYKLWRAEQTDLPEQDEDDPLVSFEYFASLPRVRPGIGDSEAAKRRVQYRGKDRHVADLEGEGDACNKAFSIRTGLTQGVFNVVCPHVITLGFRCLFRAESVGEAVSIVLERFPQLPKVVFYDVACKFDKNAMRRVRPIFRNHGVRCVLDRPHSITHSCSPVYMPDEALGTTAGVATQAAEVSHSIAVVNRTSLAYMSPTTYMLHKMAQVAFMNLRKLYRLHADTAAGENDHVALAPFFHSKVAHQCERVALCSCSPDDPVSAKDEPVGTDRGAAASTDLVAADADTAAVADQAVANGGIAADEMQVGNHNSSDGIEAGTNLKPTNTSRGSECEGPCATDLSSAGVAVIVARSAGETEIGLPRDRVSTGNFCSAPAGVGSSGRSSDEVIEMEVKDEEWILDEDVPAKDVAPAPADNLLHPELHAEHARWVVGRGALGFAPLDTSPLCRQQRQLVRELIGAAPAATVRPLNKSRVRLAGADFLRLGGVSWLSGEVMNSFIALINDRDERARLSNNTVNSRPNTSKVLSSLPRTRMLSTYFFSRLSPRRGHYCYDHVRKWGVKAGLDLEAVDNIIIPVHLDNSHWLLVVVDVAQRTLRFYDSLSLVDAQDVVGVVRRWLHDEVLARLGSAAGSEWAVDEWQVSVDPTTPRQSDAGSCGVFALAAADCFSLGVPLRFSQGDVRTLRRRIALALFFDDLDCGLELSHCAALTAAALYQSDEDGSASSSELGEGLSASGDDYCMSEGEEACDAVGDDEGVLGLPVNTAVLSLGGDGSGAA